MSGFRIRRCVWRLHQNSGSWDTALGTAVIGVKVMKIHWEEDEFRYWGVAHMKASDAADWDKAFALGFWDMRGQDL